MNDTEHLISRNLYVWVEKFNSFLKKNSFAIRVSNCMTLRCKWRQLSQYSSGLFPHKTLDETINFGIHLYRDNSDNLFPHILSSLQRMLKTICEFCKYFGWILFPVFIYRFSFKFRVKFRKFISLTKNLLQSCPEICHFTQKVGLLVL